MIELVEYRSSTHELTPGEAAELAAMTRGTTGGAGPRVIERLTPGRAPGTYDIQPGPYVGRFALRSGRVVDVASRFPFADLAALLGLARRTTLLHESAAPAGGGDRLLDLIATAFVREAHRVAGQGLLKNYRRETFHRPPYPGVPAATEHLRLHAARPDRLVTTANRLSPDVPLNRLVATAHRRLSALSYADRKLTADLRGLAPVFQRIGRACDERVGPVPSRYREIHDLARLVLDGRTVLPTGTGASGVSVLFSMTTIWEDYVGRWLRVDRPDGVVSAQHPIVLADAGEDRPPVRADFVLSEAGQPTAVYDAKYKPWRRSPSTDEIYQMYTYARRLGVSRAVLVYPGTAPQRAEIVIDGIAVENRTLVIATARETSS